MPSLPNAIPVEVTSGELAGALEVSERRVAALKAEGRLPVSRGGHILLRELLAQMHHEAAARGRKAAKRRPAPEGAHWSEANPEDAAARSAMTVYAHLLPGVVARLAVEAGAGVGVAYALHRLIGAEALPLRNAAMELCGILEDPDAPPDPAATCGLVPPDWSALAEQAGEAVDLAAWEAYATGRVGPAASEAEEGAE